MKLSRTSSKLLALAALALLALPLQADAPEAGVYTARGITIKFPISWRIEAASSSASFVIARAPDADKDDSGAFYANINITATRAGKVDGAAAQALNQKNLPNYKPVEEPAAVTINGLEGTTFGGTFSLKSTKLRNRQYLLTTDKAGYVLTITTLETHWQKHAPTAEAAIQTLRLASEK